MNHNYLVEAINLSKHFASYRGLIRRHSRLTKAVDGITLQIKRGHSFGLVGESGCGKSTFARMLLGLITPTAGTVIFDERDLLTLKAEEMRHLRTEMQLVFQDPRASINPRKTIKQILAQPFKLHTDLDENEINSRVIELLQDVGLLPVDQYINRYPHELSGGQCQRIGVARAIALKPKFIVADEPVSALDVSIRAKLLNLLKEIKEKYSLTSLFISHDLSLVRSMCDDMAVMYLGRIVETGPTETIFTTPYHPYTKALIDATPIPDPKNWRKKKANVIILEGEVPNSAAPPPGCHFHPRCPFKRDDCVESYPELRELQAQHFVACHYATPEGVFGMKVNKDNK